jgi:hypothetical protein
LPSAVEIDHFIPRARHPDDSVGNLVVAHVECNRAKSDYLASLQHLRRWLDWARTNEAELDRIAADRRWERHPDRTFGAARSIYLRLPRGVTLWRGRGAFEPAEPGDLEAAWRATAR